MVTDALAYMLTPCPYRMPAIDMPERCQSQLLPASRTSGPVWSPNKPNSSRLTR